jgi:protein-S-isoprenylcysteine O-methyltransferase Ste14
MRESIQSVGSGAERGPVAFPPPVVYIGGLLIGGLLEVPFRTPNLPPWLAVTVGVLGAAASVSLDINSMTLFRRKRTPVEPWRPTTALVTEGPYRVSRNPMYLGMALLYVALSLALGLVWSLALLPVVILILDVAVIRREEAYLAEKYGEEYLDYRRNVRRWI